MYSVPRCIYILQINSAKTRLIVKSFQSVKDGDGFNSRKKKFPKNLVTLPPNSCSERGDLGCPIPSFNQQNQQRNVL